MCGRLFLLDEGGAGDKEWELGALMVGVSGRAAGNGWASFGSQWAKAPSDQGWTRMRRAGGLGSPRMWALWTVPGNGPRGMRYCAHAVVLRTAFTYSSTF